MENKKDIFISYKNDGEGRYFAEKLSNTLKEQGFSVYYNSDEQHAGSFPKRLSEAIENCKDFLLVLSQACLDQLIRYEKVDWVREEITIAQKNGKNIVPLLMPGVTMPKDKDDMPEQLQFLPHEDAVNVSDPFDKSPLDCLLGYIKSSPANREMYSDIANNSSLYNVQDDFNETLAKAKDGNVEAMYEVGCMYYYGFASESDNNAKVDYNEAGKWLKKVSESEHELAYKADIMIGKLYYAGLMPYEEQSFKKCIEYYEKSGNAIPGVYYERVGFMRSESVGLDFDFEQILKFFDSCESNCSNTTKNNMAKFYMNYGLFDKAIEILESIDECYPDAEYKLGLLYQRGLHRQPPMPDVYRAEHHFQKAAAKNHLDSIHALGLLNFRATNGYKKNFAQARAYFKNAAEKGHRGAQYDYAWMCAYGLGGNRDIETAIIYFETSAKKGHILSIRELVTLYQLEEHRNYQKAFEWANKGSEAGDAICEFVLGNLYFFGRGCESDINKAMINYQKALKQGIYQAEIMINRIEKIMG